MPGVSGTSQELCPSSRVVVLAGQARHSDELAAGGETQQAGRVAVRGEPASAHTWRRSACVTAHSCQRTLQLNQAPTYSVARRCLRCSSCSRLSPKSKQSCRGRRTGRQRTAPAGWRTPGEQAGGRGQREEAAASSERSHCLHPAACTYHTHSATKDGRTRRWHPPTHSPPASRCLGSTSGSQSHSLQQDTRSGADQPMQN